VTAFVALLIPLPHSAKIAPLAIYACIGVMWGKR
jgi:hypothetical protein